MNGAGYYGYWPERGNTYRVETSGRGEGGSVIRNGVHQQPRPDDTCPATARINIDLRRFMSLLSLRYVYVSLCFCFYYYVLISRINRAFFSSCYDMLPLLYPSSSSSARIERYRLALNALGSALELCTWIGIARRSKSWIQP